MLDDYKKELTVHPSGPLGFISQKVFLKSFYKSQFPHKFVNLFSTSGMMKDMLTILCGN